MNLLHEIVTNNEVFI